MFPRDCAADARRPSVRLSDRYSGPERRMIIRLDTTHLAAVHKVYPDTGLILPSYRSLDEVLRAGQLQSCDLHSWILVCGPRLKGDAKLLDCRIVLRIRSRAWLNRLRERRPGYAYLSRQEAGGDFTYSDSVAIEYLEPRINQL